MLRISDELQFAGVRRRRPVSEYLSEPRRAADGAGKGKTISRDTQPFAAREGRRTTLFAVVSQRVLKRVGIVEVNPVRGQGFPEPY